MADPRIGDGQEPAQPVERARRGGGRRGRPWFIAVLVGVAVLVAAFVAVVLPPGQGARQGGASPPSAPVADAPSPAADASSSVGVASPSARAGPVTGRLAVVDAAGALSTMDARGDSAVSLAVPGVVFGHPAWSPDGTLIAAIGTGRDDTGIYVFDAQPGAAAGSTKPTVIYRSADHPPFYLYWSPDGARVAFLATEGSDISLRIAPADGSAPLDGGGAGGIIREGAPLYFTWEDAGRLLVHVGVGSDAFAGEVDLKGASLGAAIPGTGDFRAAAVSGDGTRLAYAGGESAGGEVVVEARDGSNRQQMPVFGPAALAFDPSGTTLASIGADTAVSNQAAFPLGPLRLIDPGTGGVRTLLGGSVVGFFWSPDGRTMAALRLAPAGGTSADSGSVVAAGFTSSATPGPIAAATAAPVMQVHLTFVDVATGKVLSDRTIRLANDFVETILPYFDQYALSHRVWAPDSTSIVLPLVDANERARAVVLGPDDTDGRPVADAVGAFWAP